MPSGASRTSGHPSGRSLPAKMTWNHLRSQMAECWSRPSNDSELTVGMARASSSLRPLTFRINASRAWSRKLHRASRSVAVENASVDMPRTLTRTATPVVPGGQILGRLMPPTVKPTLSLHALQQMARRGRMNRRAVGYMTAMTRRPVVVAAWLWAIVVVLWAGRASYAIVRVLGADVVFVALVVVAVGAAVVQVRRHGLPVRARTVTDKASIGS